MRSTQEVASDRHGRHARAVGEAVDLATLGERYELRHLRRTASALLVDAVRRTSLEPCLLWLPSTSEDPRAFRGQAERMLAWQHPSHCRVSAVEDSGGAPFAVLELPRGDTLARALSIRSFTIDEGMQIGLAVCEALLAAHDIGLVHGALDADAVVLEGAVPLVIGVGLAPVRADAAAADQSAIAGLVYMMLSGLVVGRGPSQPLHEIVANAPLALGAALSRAMAPAPQHRFPTLRAFFDVMRAARTLAALHDDEATDGISDRSSGSVRVVRITGMPDRAPPSTSAGRALTAVDDATLRLAPVDLAIPQSSPSMDDATEVIRTVRPPPAPLTAMTALPLEAPCAATTSAATMSAPDRPRSLLFGIGARSREETRMHPLAWSPPAADAAVAAKSWRGDVTKRASSIGRAPLVFTGFAATIIVALALVGFVSRGDDEAPTPSAVAPLADETRALEVGAAREDTEALLRRRGIAAGDVPAIDERLELARAAVVRSDFAGAIARLGEVAPLANVRIDASFLQRKLERAEVRFANDAGFVSVREDVQSMMATRRFADANRRLNQWLLVPR